MLDVSEEESEESEEESMEGPASTGTEDRTRDTVRGKQGGADTTAVSSAERGTLDVDGRTVLGCDTNGKCCNAAVRRVQRSGDDWAGDGVGGVAGGKSDPAEDEAMR